MGIHCKRVVARGLLALAGILGAAAASASGFSLSPMRIELSAAAPTAVLTVTNNGDAPLTIQIQPRAWRQEEGREEREATADLIVNPAVATIPPGAGQTVRVALRVTPDRERERPYRLVVREVPAADAPLSDSGFRMAVAMDIPAFVAPLAGKAAPTASYTLESGSAGLRVRIANDGSGHLRLADVALRQGGKVIAEQPVVVVLPGAATYLALPAGAAVAGPVELRAQGNAGPVEETLRAAR